MKDKWTNSGYEYERDIEFIVEYSGFNLIKKIEELEKLRREFNDAIGEYLDAYKSNVLYCPTCKKYYMKGLWTINEEQRVKYCPEGHGFYDFIGKC